ncbi:unnamed protein product [Closterium sp. NIES-53]
MAPRMPAHDSPIAAPIDEFSFIFDLMDRDRDGRISATELASVLESLGEERVEETVQAMMSQADTDGDGYVDFDEFIRVSSHSSWTSSLFEASPKSTLSASLASDCESAAEAFCRGSDGPSIDDLAAAFELFDRNKDGFITAEELSEVMGGIWEDEDMSLEECERMIRSVDLDGDGRLCFSEFVDMMLASGSWALTELSPPCQTEQRNVRPALHRPHDVEVTFPPRPPKRRTSRSSAMAAPSRPKSKLANVNPPSRAVPDPQTLESPRHEPWEFLSVGHKLNKSILAKYAEPLGAANRVSPRFLSLLRARSFEIADDPDQGLYQQRESRSDVSRSVQCRAGSGPHRRARRQFPSTPSHSTVPNSSNPSSNPFGIQQPPSTPFSGGPESPARRHRRREQWRTRLAWWDNLFSRRPPEPPPGWPGVPDEPQGGPPGDPRRRSRRAEGEPGTRRGGSGGPGGGEPGTRRGGSGGLGGWDAGTRRGGGGGPGGGESGTRRGGSGGGEAGRTDSSNRGGFSGSGGGPKIEAPGFKGSGWGSTGSGSVFGKGFGQTGPGASGSGSGSGEPGAPLPRWQKRQIVGGPDDDIDAMLADPERFERWQTSRELRGIQFAGKDPDDREWEDWIDDPSEYDYENGGWYEPQPDWEKGGMPREAPDIPERGMSRSFKELLLRIFKPQDEVEENLTFEERVFRYTSQTTVSVETSE